MIRKFITVICSLAIIVLLNNISYSQEVRLKNLHYENSSGEKGITHLYYSLENKNYKAKWELLDGSRYSINYHFLDKNGNLIRKYREFSDSIISNNFYKYDSEGNLIEDYFERSDKVKGIAWYSYKDGKKVEANCRGFNGWFTGVIKYEYTGDLLTKGLIFSGGKEVGYIEYKYDDNQNLLTEYWDFGGKWNQTFTYEYETVSIKQPECYFYSSAFLKPTKEYIIEEENYNWNNEQGGPSFYEYDGNKLVKKIYKIDSLETVTTYEYDENGLLMKSFRNYMDGRKAEFSYHYNENNQLVRRLFHGEKGFVGTESYEYNADGTLKSTRWINFDSWISGVITFENDEKGNLTSGKFKGDTKFDADIDFETDKNGNLVKIHWKFTTGHTQTYEFKYKEI